MKKNPEPAFLQEDTTPDLHQYLALAWHWAWLFILATLVGGAIGYFTSRREVPVYSSTTTIMIDTAPTTRAADYSSLILSERLTQTYTSLIQTRPIMDQVRKELRDDAIGFRGIDVSKVENSQLINISVMHTDPVKAAEFANTLVRVFGREIIEMQSERYAVSKTSLQAQVTEMEAQIKETDAEIRANRNETERANLEQKRTLYRQIYSNLLMSLEQVRLAEAQTVSSIIQIEPALPGGRVGPRVRQKTTQSAFVGLFLAVALVFGLYLLDTSVKNPDVLSRQLGLPMLGMIASHEHRPGSPIAVRHPRSPVTEAFRGLRTNVRFSGVDKPLRRLMVTSPAPEEGKTTISVNLAVVLAQSGMRVTLVDSDLRRPMIHKTLGITNGGGLSGLFMQDAPDIGVAQIETGVEGLRAVLSGSLPPNPSELLGSNKMRELLDEMLETSDILVLDTPPVMSVTDAVVLAGQVDGVLLVFRPGKTKTAMVKQAAAQLRQVNAHVIGMVANNVNLAAGGYNNYYYRRYYSKYAYYSEEGRGGRRGKAKRFVAKVAGKAGLKKKA